MLARDPLQLQEQRFGGLAALLCPRSGSQVEKAVFDQSDARKLGPQRPTEGSLQADAARSSRPG